MLFSRCVVTLLSAGFTNFAADLVVAQDYPSKPVRVVTGGVASGGDLISRQITQGISGSSGQPVIIDNRVGLPGIQTVAKAPPDGYTLLVIGNNFAYAPLLQNMPYDPVQDFAPVTLLVTSPSILVVSPTLPVNSVKELIALAKAKPGSLNYASAGTGGGAHLEAELFKAIAGVDIVRIAYKGGSGAALNDLISGRVHVLFDNPFVAMSHVKAGKLKALGVTSTEPSVLAPGLPTVAESVPGFETSTNTSMFAPAKTPATMLIRLHQEMARFLKTREVKEKFLSMGLDVVGNSPQELAARVKTDIARMGKVIKDAGIKAD